MVSLAHYPRGIWVSITPLSISINSFHLYKGGKIWSSQTCFPFQAGWAHMSHSEDQF